MTPWRTEQLEKQFGFTSVGFNAATAVTPWRTTGSRHEVTGLKLLQCGHGCDAVENDAGREFVKRPAAALQCGHGCDAVENFKRHGETDRQRRLQCGHGCDAVENIDYHAQYGEYPEASMRPRL